MSDSRQPQLQDRYREKVERSKAMCPDHRPGTGTACCTGCSKYGVEYEANRILRIIDDLREKWHAEWYDAEPESFIEHERDGRLAALIALENRIEKAGPHE